MNKRVSAGRVLGFSLLLLGLVALAGPAAGRMPEPQGTVTLVYKFAPDAPLSYKQTSSQVQDVDVMGQVMTTETSSQMDITLKSKGLKDGDTILGVTIDGMSINVQSPQGQLTPDLTGVIGKSFDLVFSPLGKEVDVSGAAVFKVDMGQSGQRDLTSSFKSLFPDLPDHPIKVGDKWPAEDVVVQKSDAADVTVTTKYEHTLDGFETVEGRECARIKSVFKGVMNGTLNQMGMSMAMDGKIDGTEVWYFDVKAGVFVKSDSKAALNGNVTVESMNMSIGFTGTQKGASLLVKK